MQSQVEKETRQHDHQVTEVLEPAVPEWARWKARPHARGGEPYGFNQTYYYEFDPNYADFGETPEKRAEYVSELTKAWTSDIGGN